MCRKTFHVLVYCTVFGWSTVTGGRELHEQVQTGFKSLGSTRTSPKGPLNIVPQQISSRRHVERSIKGSLFLVEDVREGNRNEVCEAVETLLTGWVVNELDENSSDMSLGLGLGEPHIKVGDKSPLSVSISSSSRVDSAPQLSFRPLVALPLAVDVISFPFSKLKVLELLLGFVVLFTLALLSTTCFQFFELPGGSFFQRFTRRTQALQISPCLFSFN